MLKLLKYRLRSAVGEARHDSYGRVAKQVNKVSMGKWKEGIYACCRGLRRNKIRNLPQ